MCTYQYTICINTTYIYIQDMPHKKPLQTQQVSNPSTETQRISTPAHSSGCKWEMHFKSGLMVQIQRKGVYGVDNPRPRSFLGGRYTIGIHSLFRQSKVYICILIISCIYTYAYTAVYTFKCFVFARRYIHMCDHYTYV